MKNQDLFILGMLSIVCCCLGCEKTEVTLVPETDKAKGAGVINESELTILVCGRESEPSFYWANGKVVEWQTLKDKISTAKTIVIELQGKAGKSRFAAVNQVVEHAKSLSIEYTCVPVGINLAPVSVDLEMLDIDPKFWSGAKNETDAVKTDIKSPE